MLIAADIYLLYMYSIPSYTAKTMRSSIAFRGHTKTRMCYCLKCFNCFDLYMIDQTNWSAVLLTKLNYKLRHIFVIASSIVRF